MPTSSKINLKNLLAPDEKQSLEAIYTSKGVPSDQLRRLPSVLAEIVEAFHAATGRTDLDPGLILRYMLNRRKDGDWPKLGAGARRLKPVTETLTAQQLEALRTIYESINVPSDEFLFSAKLMARIATEFRKATGAAIPGSLLVAAIMAKRKRGDWVRIRPVQESFADIEVVHKTHLAVRSG